MEFHTSCERRFEYVLLRGYRDGQQFKEKIKYKPTIYLPSNKLDTTHKSLENVSLEPFKAGSMKDTADFIKKYEGVDNFDYFGMDKFEYACLQERYPTEMDYDSNLIRIGYMDIEVESDGGFPDPEKVDEKINLINVFFKNHYYVFALEIYGEQKYENTRDDVKYFAFTDESEMLRAFLVFWEKASLDVITGWYVEGFDIPYLLNRIEKLLGNRYVLKFSPWGYVKKRYIELAKGNRPVFDIQGVSTLDYLDVYKKFAYKFPDNFKLDTIAHNELGFGKLDHSEYETMAQIYRNDWSKFVDYNIRDTEIIIKLEKKLQLLELIFNLSYTAKVNYIDTFKQTVMWDCIINDYLLQQNIVIPRRPRKSKDESFIGAYVMEPTPALYKWGVSFDYDSLYPHLIMQYNIGPDTFMLKEPVNNEDLIAGIDQRAHDIAKKNNFSLAANGTMYSKDKMGFLAAIMNKMYEERRDFKQKMIATKIDIEKTGETPDKLNAVAKYDVLQSVKKVVLNSAYGAIGNPGFRFFNPDYAEAITISGQLATKWIERKLDEKMNLLFKTTGQKYVFYADTDSVYARFDELREIVREKIPSDEVFVDFLDQFIKEKVKLFIEQSLDELKDYMNAYSQKMSMKREKICNKVLLTSRKKYILSVWDNEGIRYKEPKLSITGVEAIRSSTPELCRKGLKKAFEIIMNKEESELQKYIAEFKEEFFAAAFEDVCFPRGVNGMVKYSDDKEIYKKGTPIHTRAALLYNNLLKKHNLENKYETIKEGEKIKFGYLKIPNVMGENIIAFINYIPREFELADYYDYELQFEKSFSNPLNNVLDIIQWVAKKETTLEDFFA